FGSGLARGRRVEGVHIGEQDQRVGTEQLGDERRQAVVVAEADLVGGGGVVLVDNRDGAEPQQRLERGAHVAVGLPADHVRLRQQHLAGGPAVPGEGALPGGGQQRLADARRRLLQRDRGRSLGQPQRSQGGGDRP